jgi:hypothetical protein
MSAPARSAQSALREIVASMSPTQLAYAASVIGVSRATLVAFAEGRSTLPDFSLARLGEHVFAGRFLIKQEEQRA